KAAIEQVLAQGKNLSFFQEHIARLDQIDPRIIEQRRIGQLQDFAVGIDFERRKLLQAEREIQVAVGIVGGPSAAAIAPISAIAAAAIGRIANTDERKDVMLEPLV